MAFDKNEEILQSVCLGGVKVTFSPRVRKFAVSYPTEVVGLFQDEYFDLWVPRQAFQSRQITSNKKMGVVVMSTLILHYNMLY